MSDKPYRYMFTLDPETGRALAQLRADSADGRGKTKSYADIVRQLIHDAAGKRAAKGTNR